MCRCKEKFHFFASFDDAFRVDCQTLLAQSSTILIVCYIGNDSCIIIAPVTHGENNKPRSKVDRGRSLFYLRICMLSNIELNTIILTIVSGTLSSVSNEQNP